MLAVEREGRGGDGVRVAAGGRGELAGVMEGAAVWL